MGHDQASELPVITHTAEGPLLGICCNKCRTVRFTVDEVSATRMMMDHAKTCRSHNMIIAELVTRKAGT